MDFLHDGIPMPTRKAVVDSGTGCRPCPQSDSKTTGRAARCHDQRPTPARLLAHPNIASKHWIIRQYDHEVQGGSVIKPLIGPLQIGPSRRRRHPPQARQPSRRRPRLRPGAADRRPLRHGPRRDRRSRSATSSPSAPIPTKIAILDNFCWPSVDDEQTMGTLVRACEACRDAALAYGIPFISGKDSLHNQFTNSETGEVIRIPNTLLISAIGVIDDVRKCVTMDLKKPRQRDLRWSPPRDQTDLADARRDAPRVAAAITPTGWSRACHDVSDGGVARRRRRDVHRLRAGAGRRARAPSRDALRGAARPLSDRVRPDSIRMS